MVLFYLDRIAPALLRQATYGTIKIGVYHTLKRAVISNPKGKFLFSHCHAFDSFLSFAAVSAVQPVGVVSFPCQACSLVSSVDTCLGMGKDGHGSCSWLLFFRSLKKQMKETVHELCFKTKNLS